VVLNETEAGELLEARIGSERSEERAVKRLAAAVGGGIAVLTRGARGALVAAGGRIEPQLAFPVRVVDTTAAGDAFTGAFAARLLETGDPFGAARAAAAAGALAVSRPGARSSLPGRREVLRMAGL
jgi:ribokinase